MMSIYRLHVSLLEIAPLIWRRVEITSETSLARLHDVLQAAMGWKDYHLHEFEIAGQRYGVPNPYYDEPGEVFKESSAKLSNVLPCKGATLLYTYDFGDYWQHMVTLEDIVPSDPAQKYPRIVDGARCCPPEDCGGSCGYADLLDILSKPRHKEHRHMREWAGEHFDPERFSAPAAEALIQRRRSLPSGQRQA